MVGTSCLFCQNAAASSVIVPGRKARRRFVDKSSQSMSKSRNLVEILTRCSVDTRHCCQTSIGVKRVVHAPDIGQRHCIQSTLPIISERDRVSKRIYDGTESLGSVVANRQDYAVSAANRHEPTARIVGFHGIIRRAKFESTRNLRQPQLHPWWRHERTTDAQETNGHSVVTNNTTTGRRRWSRRWEERIPDGQNSLEHTGCVVNSADAIGGIPI